jgi:hypothetical protein
MEKKKNAYNSLARNVEDLENRVADGRIILNYGFNVCRLCGLDPEVRVRFPTPPDFMRLVSLERGPLSLVSTIEELLERNSSGSGLENREYGRRNTSR